MGKFSGFSAGSNPAIDIANLRERLRKMTDEELTSFGESARLMCSPEANFGKAPNPVFVVQLEEAESEWKRREGLASGPPQNQ